MTAPRPTVHRPGVIVVMGVSGSGKTVVGRRLAQRLGWPFVDADDLHPQANIDAMAAGVPLTDAARGPWLDRLRDLIAAETATGRSLVLACSALKRAYREHLGSRNRTATFVYLKGDIELISGRLRRRAGHFMTADLLASQFEALEEPSDAITVSIDQDLDAIVGAILAALTAAPTGPALPDA